MVTYHKPYPLPDLMLNQQLINQTSIKLGESIDQLQQLQACYDDPAIAQLLSHIADYQYKLVAVKNQLTTTTEKETQAA